MYFLGLCNGINDFKNSLHLSLNKPASDLDYLTQLLKDKKQLAAFPNVFNHIERLLDDGNAFFVIFNIQYLYFLNI